MGMINRIAESTDLIVGMAERLGVNLSHRFGTSPDAQALMLRSAILRCAGCREHGVCATLQAQNGHLTEVPSYCWNARLFEDLA